MVEDPESDIEEEGMREAIKDLKEQPSDSDDDSVPEIEVSDDEEH